MKLITETKDNPVTVLIIHKKETTFISKLKAELSKKNVEVFTSTNEDEDYSKYDICFFVHISGVLPSEFLDYPDKKVVFIFFDENNLAQTYSSFAYEHKLQNIKIINLQSRVEHYDKDIDTILWFAFSRNNDIYLHIYHQNKRMVKKTNAQFKLLPKITLQSVLQPKNLIALGIVFILATHIIFIPPLILSSIFHYYSAKNIIKQDFTTGARDLAAADSSLQAAKALYNFPKATLHFFSLALFPENVLQINETLNDTLHTVIALKNDGADFANLISFKNKSPEEIEMLYKKKTALLKNIDKLDEDITFLEEKIPEWNPKLVEMKQQLVTTHGFIEHVKEISPYLDTIFAKNTEKKYLLLFANNMEIRPGGGFIGSFAIVKVKDYTITEMKVYDVYDADGQLKDQIDPPKPIVDYLNQTHYFLRDSAFSPDFVDNLAEAKHFLELELGETDFDGGILLTTAAAQNLLSALNSVYVPDFKETVTADNFYIKAQLYAEEDFFPGSQQKKQFLSSVMDQMLLHLPEASFPNLLQMIDTSLNEKQIVFYMDDPKVQSFIEQNYWAGRTLTPKCSLDDAYNCVLDFVFPFDANLGVNKANFFVQKPTKLHIDIDRKGNIVNTLTITYKNNSYPDVFPGGVYKNYFQTYFPPNTKINSVRVDDIEKTSYDETNFEYKTLGFMVEIEPQASKTIEIKYTLPTTIISGDGIYQLIYQKQIGSPNYDFQLSFTFPSNITVNNKNFSPLVKDNEILYNTQISSDKIFVIEFSKQQ